ncbi:D-alanyl-D-alanine carboxypeptidase [Chitinivorax tropicus]|uniref:D-alanyl-D-alanine carboxypeptidase n=1 Tax=Chitinivorax tropicus TaxID=714531 RepID=A0A840MRY0_9PROT|nr:M15 family metallopeptidase [Chitinivorax tropicus]MBB5019013.1 D-alanyl-D-alanine carboxypeptidase [Chitinivorax tropicus]
MNDQAHYLAYLQGIHQQLGIPADYAARFRLPVQFEATRLTPVGLDKFDRDAFLDEQTAAAWRQMQSAADEAGVCLELVSGFRSVAYQQGLIVRKLAKGLSMEAILAASAAPGYSEHHTGRALDLATPGADVLEESFELTPAFAWLQQHAARFGFVMSFPRENPHGILYEPWHWAWQPAQEPHS